MVRLHIWKLEERDRRVNPGGFQGKRDERYIRAKSPGVVLLTVIVCSAARVDWALHDARADIRPSLISKGLGI